jgi:hypothetical protein
MNAPRSSLTEVATAELERLRDAIAHGTLRTSLTRTSLVGFGVRHQLDALEAALAGHSRMACLSILDVVLSERKKRDRPSPELVWTGPEARYSTARDTAVVLRGLFESATEHVILAGYSFTHAKSVLLPLYRVMSERGVVASFFVDLEQPKHATNPPELHAEAALAAFLSDNWPFGSPFPRLYYDRRAIVPPPP